MPAGIPSNCAWVGGVSPADAPEAATALATVEAVNARIRWHLDQVGLLRAHKTKLHRAERAVALTAIRRDFEAGMSRPAICRKYRISIGQLTGAANRGGWQCGVRRRGHISDIPAERMPEIKATYETDARLLKDIAAAFGITRFALHYHAKQGGWVRKVGPTFVPGAVTATAHQVSP